MKKTLAILIVVLLAGWVGYKWYGAGAERPTFRTLPVTRGDLSIGATATGSVEPVEVIDVGAQIVGMIKSFGTVASEPGKTIDFNSRVKKGDVLAQLDDLPFKAEVEKATAGLLLAEAEVKQVTAHLDQAKRVFDRAKKLIDTNSAAEYEAAQSQYEIAQAELAMCLAKVAQAKSVKKQAEINLDYAVIRAPADGTVIDRRVNAGQTVVAGLNAPSLFLLAKDLGRMQVLAAVNEADISQVHTGQKVTFKVDAYPHQTFHGTVSQIRLDSNHMGTVVTYPVVIDADNAEGKLMKDMTAKIQFEEAGRGHVLLVPDQALRWRPTWEQITPSARSGLTPPAPRKAGTAEDKEGESPADEATVDTAAPTVWVRAADGLVRPVRVELGLSDGMNTELTGGKLQENDELVIDAVRAAKPDFVSSFINKVIH